MINHLLLAAFVSSCVSIANAIQHDEVYHELNSLAEQKFALLEQMHHEQLEIASLREKLIKTRGLFVKTQEVYQKDYEDLGKYYQLMGYWTLQRHKKLTHLFSSSEQEKAKLGLWKQFTSQQESVLQKKEQEMSELITQANDLMAQENHFKAQEKEYQALLTLLQEQQIEQQHFYNQIVAQAGEESHTNPEREEAHQPLPSLSARSYLSISGAHFWAAKPHEKIVSIGQGKVIYADYIKGMGLTVMIDHGDGCLSVYGNCSKLLKNVDQVVSAGEGIAFIGSTGQFHKEGLYFEIRHKGALQPHPKWM